MNAKQLITAVAMLTATGAVLAERTDYVRADLGFVSTKTRTEVIGELKQAQADGSYQTAHAEYQGPVSVLAHNAGTTAESATASVIPGAKSVVLNDGSTVYVFNDGKMGMESKFGKAVRMNPGHVMETNDGQKILMVGDEVARLNSKLHTEYTGQ